MSTLKEKLANKEVAIGTQVMMNDIAITDIFTELPYDFLWIDTEHSPIDYHQLLEHITLCDSKGIASLVRLHVDDYNHTKRVLEMGPTGVIFPMINTKEEAEKAILSTYYPPKGNRGSGPQRFAKYGFLTIEEWMKKQDDMVRCIQLETKASIDNLEEIVEVEGIDCFIFGLWDLSLDIGKPGDVLCDEEKAYVKRAISILKAHNKSIGMACGVTNKQFLDKVLSYGITCITTGGDFEYLRNGAKENFNLLSSLKNDK